MSSIHVNTIADLLSIALQAEHEAVRRYTQLAATMREGNNASAADLFERMVREEEEHERLLQQWMAQDNIPVNPAIGPVRWRDPHVSKVYNEEACDPYYSTPYRALAFAVHNEEIAFRFYTHVAANADDKEVRRYAEILAREELGHAALLRAERRRAYHAERMIRKRHTRLEPAAVHNIADLLTAAVEIESHLLNAMKTIEREIPAIAALASGTRQQIDDHRAQLDKLPAAGPAIHRNLEQIRQDNAQAQPEPDDPDAVIAQLYADSDHSFAFYDAVVERAADENVMLTAQALASSALDRIEALKQLTRHADKTTESNNASAASLFDFTSNPS
ncbi:MAG: ferritin family protein [Gammaproteobacteria bacterium]|jgi:rubrerythrin